MKYLCLIFYFLYFRAQMSTSAEIYFPAETEPHERTFMCWPQEVAVWEDTLKDVQKDVAGIAAAISNFEPVTVLASSGEYDRARRMLGRKIDVLKLDVNDLWARDTLPAFVFKNDNLTGVDLNFNGWGGKQKERESDSEIPEKLLSRIELPLQNTWLVTEGGALEMDGDGTLLVTESSIINDNRNPGKSKDDIEKELKSIFGITKIIWFKGVKGEDVTDAHVDCLVRFVRPGRVIVNRPHPDEADENDVWTKSANEALNILKKETDANGRSFEIVELFEPSRAKIENHLGYKLNDEFVASYTNFYIVNGGVIIPKFGDKEADRKAMQVVQKEFQDRKVVAVDNSNLAAGGGGIHCATHELPASNV